MQINFRNTKYALLGLSACLLASCSLSSIFAADTEKNIDNARTSADEVAAKAALPADPLTIDTVRVKPEVWLGDTSSKIADSEPLPARFETDNAITLVGNREVTLFEVAEKITSLTGLLVRIDDLLLDNAGESSSGAETSASVSYSGKLSGLLDQICSRFGIWWKYKAGVITFYEMETRSYTIYALPTQNNLSASMSNSASSESGGTATSSIDASVSMDSWAQITETIQNMLPQAAKMSVSSTSGMITVTAPPETLRKIGKYVRDINEKLSRQVAITVRVIQVVMDKEKNFGLDLSAAFSKTLGNTEHSLNFSSVGPAALNGVSDVTATYGILHCHAGKSCFDMTGILKALSTQGDASLVTTATVTTMNNKVAPIQVSESEDYLSNLERTKDGDTNEVSISTETDTLDTGFTMSVLPRILDHGRLLMLFNMSFVRLEKWSSYDLKDGNTETTGTILKLPTTSTKGFSQEVILRSGSTLVIAGFDQMRNELQKKGFGHVDNPIGGGFASQDEKVVMVILITPEVLVSPLTPETRVTDM